MPKKPPWRRNTIIRADNDNDPKAKPMPRYAWYIYRAAARARWIGQVVAGNADEAVEVAAVEFKTDVRKLIAVRRYETA